MFCNCIGCLNSTSGSLLQKIRIGCSCILCKRKESMPFLYMSCVEIHFSLEIGYDTDSIKLIIAERKKKYERKF